MTPRSTARRMVDSSASPSTRDKSSAKRAWFTQSIRSPLARVEATKLKRWTIDAAGAALELGEDRPLVDAGVDALLQDARRFLLGERDHARDEIAARHGAGMEGHELIEQQHRETPLLLVGFWRGGRNDGWNMWLGSHPRGYTTGPLRRPPRELRGRLWLVHLRVVGPQRGTCPARLGDEVLEQEDVVAQVRRVAQLVR